MKKLMILFLSTLIMVCSVSGCHKKDIKSDIVKNSILNEENEHLIGEEVVEESPNANEIQEYNYDSEMKTTDIVKKIEVDHLKPSSFVEIEIDDSNESNVPAQIMVNNSVSILTKKEHKGWTLQKGDVIEYKFEKYESNVVKNQALLIGCIIDGEMKMYEVFDDLNGTYLYEVEENAEYYIYLMSASSDYLSIKDSQLNILLNEPYVE